VALILSGLIMFGIRQPASQFRDRLETV